MDTSIIKPMVRKILENPLGYDWSLQGFGMMRLYLTRDLRLHVWSTDHKVDGVSSIHTHPWDLTSYIVSGRIQNLRFVEITKKRAKDLHYTRMERVVKQKLLCGEGGGICGMPKSVILERQSPEYYGEGKIYKQKANEIHTSFPDDGTVTLVDKTVVGKDPDHAFTYYYQRRGFISGAPRRATTHEVIEICHKALTKWKW